MSEKSPSEFPHKSLGQQIKTLREHNKQSLAEVSGAVEIEPEALRKIEQGIARPSEDILMLLISHFEIKDDDAVSLWELAGYTKEQTAKEGVAMHDDKNQQTIMIMPMDARVIYTDTVQVSVNNYGVIMNFMQNNGSNNQPMAISRIGMSREHAKSVVELLQQSLAQAEAHQTQNLPQPKPKSDQSN
jgi:transcriptional regulator with XRE-family HTH domain